MRTEKILLAMLPYWTPNIPPMGISCLKSFLRHYHYDVKVIDLNTAEKFANIYNRYFEQLKKYIPSDMRGNFYNTGHDLLRNHMMAHLNYRDEKKYLNLVKTIIHKTFFTDISESQVRELNNMIATFYSFLERVILTLLQQEKPGILGLSVYSGTLPASLFTFKLARENFPGLMTVMGGGIFADQLKVGSPDFDFFLEKTPYIDKIIVGEGERLFLKLLRGQLPASRRVYTPDDLDKEFLDLGRVDIPDFSDFDLSLYPHLTSYASRSCPFQCTFCSETLQWGKYRKKEADQIRQELIKLYRKYNYQLFLMTDSLLNPVIQGLVDELIAANIPIYWDGYLRVDKSVCDSEKTLHWRRGGFYRARLGLESGSQHMLDLMEKKISVEQIKEAVKSVAAAGIKTTTYWVIGHPGETEDDFRQTLDLIEELKNDLYEAECNPFNFFLSGQVKSDYWVKRNKISTLYPEEAKEMLIVQTWILQNSPSRQETYSRIRRFVEFCKGLGIPNPYSLKDIYQADERWKKLHKNAVPSLVEFKNTSGYIDECRNVKRLNAAAKMVQDHMTFHF